VIGMEFQGKFMWAC